MELKVVDVAKLLNVSEKTIYRWIKEDFIPSYRINEQYRFNRSDILEWATAKKINISTDIFAEKEDPSPWGSSLSKALEAGGIYYKMIASDKEQALQVTVQKMNLPKEVDRDQLLKMLMAREALASTAIGDGIAIPHVRYPIVAHVSEPTIALSFFDKPVGFGALDGKPVYCLFLMINPTVRTHLQLLSKLAFALRDPKFLALIQKKASRDEVLSALRHLEKSISTSQKESSKHG